VAELLILEPMARRESGWGRRKGREEKGKGTKPFRFGHVFLLKERGLVCLGGQQKKRKRDLIWPVHWTLFGTKGEKGGKKRGGGGRGNLVVVRGLESTAL